MLESVFVRLAEDGVFSVFEGVIEALEDQTVTEQFVNRLASLGLNATMSETYAAGPAELLDVYRRSAATVSTRLHGAIFSFLAGTPAVTISADPRKAEGVMEVVGLQDWVLAPTAAVPDQLYEQLIKATQPTTRAEIASLLDDAAERVSEAESTIESILNSISNKNRSRK